MGFNFTFNKKGENDDNVSITIGMNDKQLTLGYDDDMITDSNMSLSMDKEDVDEIRKMLKEAEETRKNNNKIEKERKHQLKLEKQKLKQLKSPNDK